MKLMKTFVMTGTAALAGLALAASTAHAQSVADFYKGKTVTIVVGHQAGTGFDVYSRVLIRHMGRHIPGNPNMIVQNMPGASGIKSANWLYNAAPKDGTAIGTFSQNVPLEPAFGNKSARFDPMKFNWVGYMDRSIAVCAIAKSAGVDTFEELKKKETVFGATGATGPLIKAANATKNLLGANLKVIAGYRGSASVKSAILKGEVKGICGLPWSTIKSFWGAELKNGIIKPIVQLSGGKADDLKGVPHARDMMKTDEERQLYKLIFGLQEIGRIYALPPDVPADRVAALRKAFLDTMKDEKFLADAKKTRIDINPASGEELTNAWAELVKTPQDIIEKVKQITLPKK